MSKLGPYFIKQDILFFRCLLHCCTIRPKFTTIHTMTVLSWWGSGMSELVHDGFADKLLATVPCKPIRQKMLIRNLSHYEATFYIFVIIYKNFLLKFVLCLTPLYYSLTKFPIIPFRVCFCFHISNIPIILHMLL